MRVRGSERKTNLNTEFNKIGMLEFYSAMVATIKNFYFLKMIKYSINLM